MAEVDEMQQELQRLQAENEALRSEKRTSGTLTFKVSDKGAVSVYGLGRFPVTLYQEQWDKLLAQVEELRRFINDNRARLKKKE